MKKSEIYRKLGLLLNKEEELEKLYKADDLDVWIEISHKDSPIVLREKSPIGNDDSLLYNAANDVITILLRNTSKEIVELENQLKGLDE